ncbi:DNA-packaging protein [Methanoregula sp.]|uniref:DNA-packaging protein n=1 Tax=Methanoregula sp. TaxID=2052170 RepID=UPI003564C166
MLAASLPASDLQVLNELNQRFFISKARPAQIPPSGSWQYWMLKAGRGFGKTRVGGEWSVKQAREIPRSRGALIAPTAADARDVMVEGESGILAISPDNFMPLYEPSKRRLTWPNGTIATLYSGEEPNRLRGPQHHWVWADEMASWKYPETWDMALFGLRLGKNPRAVITTTPRPIAIIKELMKDPRCVVTGGSTYENKDNLAPLFITSIVKKYEGTRLGRQELNAEILDDNPGALWNRATIEALRSPKPKQFLRIVVGVDPAVSGGEESDETGIIVDGVDAKGHGYTLADYSIRGTPYEWALQVVRAVQDWKADRVIGEVNNGGDLVEMNLRRIDPNIPFRSVHATRGKAVRAEPIAALYEQGRWHHVGAFPQLEDQMCDWVPNEPNQKSPDRMDAHVWAAIELTANTGGRIRATGRTMEKVRS